MKQPELLPNNILFIENCADIFEPIGLGELQGAELMDRREEKYVIKADLLPELLDQLQADYRILEIEGKRLFRYVSQYYDTADLELFHEHRKGHLNRYKIRKRRYIDSGTAYFEVKFKDNHGRTLKSRIRVAMPEDESLHSEEDLFLKEVCPYSALTLAPSISIEYQRITLVSRYAPERVTIDLNLKAVNQATGFSFDRLAIIEVKQEKLKSSKAKQALKLLGQRPGTLSKYCLGIISLQDVRYNRLKPTFDRLYKPFLTSITS